jgi:hypothetical protein
MRYGNVNPQDMMIITCKTEQQSLSFTLIHVAAQHALQPTTLSGQFSALVCFAAPSRLCCAVLSGWRLSFTVGRPGTMT